VGAGLWRSNGGVVASAPLLPRAMERWVRNKLLAVAMIDGGAARSIAIDGLSRRWQRTPRELFANSVAASSMFSKLWAS